VAVFATYIPESIASSIDYLKEERGDSSLAQNDAPLL